jgi:hypothetical protein
MNLLATASELQVKGLSQIQETRSQSINQPPPPAEVKATRQPPLTEASKAKPVAGGGFVEGKLGKQLSLVQDVGKTIRPEHQQQLQHNSSSCVLTPPSLKRKHDQLSTTAGNSNSYSVHNSSNANHHPGPDRISFHKGGSSNSSSLQEDSEDRLRPARVSDLKKETVDVGGGGIRCDREALATLHEEENSSSKQVSVP